MEMGEVRIVQVGNKAALTDFIDLPYGLYADNPNWVPPLKDEVRGLLPRGLKRNPSAARAIGYRETIDCLEGRLPESELAAAIAQNTRALVRKQPGAQRRSE